MHRRFSHRPHRDLIHALISFNPEAPMTRVNKLRLVAATLVMSAAMGIGCDVQVSIILPNSATASDTQEIAMPDGARLVVNNEIGGTRVEVDPTATMATVVIHRTAVADTQEEADELLTKIVVTVTAPTAGDNTLRIDAPTPDEATGTQGQFQFNTANGEFQITGLTSSVSVAHVNLRITLPPGHEVEVTHKVGTIRAIGLDAESTLMTTTGAIRSQLGKAAIIAETTTGAISIESHDGSLNLRTQTGAVSIELTGLGADEEVFARLTVGSISLDLPEQIDADLTAITELGEVDFDNDDFAQVSNLTETNDSVEATLNDGGPTIDVRTGLGDIDIDGF